MDAPESSVNRIGRTIWTVWGYLSGAVARYLRPEVTDEGNQSGHYRSHEIDLKTTANKINKEVKANNSEEEEKKCSQNDKSTAEVKCSLPEVREQVASVAWENTDVVKDDNNDELHVDTSRKQTVSCAVWSTGTGDHGERVSGDSESEGRKSGERVENEAFTSDEGQAERSNAKTECKESETAQELDETGRIEQKHGDDEECDQKREDEKCSNKREDPHNADVAVQSELYGEDVEEVNMTGHGETESLGGFKHADEHLIDEMETNVGQIDREKTKIDKNQRTQSMLPELECSTEEADGLSMPEGLKVLEKYSDEIAEFSKNEVEEMIPGKRDGIESEQDTTKFELLDSVEMLQEVSKEISENNISNNETELKITSVLDETVNASEDALQLDSKQDTPQNISETGTGSPVVAIKSECMFSDLIVCEFPGELRKGPETALAETDLGCFEDIKIHLHEPQSLAEEQTERETFVAHCVEHSETQEAAEEAVETEQDIETPIKSLGATESQTHQEIDETKFPLKEHVELRTELIVETTETNINTEDEEAEPFKTQSQSSNIRNVTFQTHELLEFTEGQCKLSQETMDTFSESLGNSSVSEITGTAEIDHVSEDQTDGKPVLTRTLSPAEFLEETLDLQGESERCIEEQETLDTEVVKTAVEFVEEITNQVLKEMIDAAINFETAKTESLAGLLAEEHSVQEPEECVSAGAFVLEEERKLLGETMGSTVEMEVETAIREVAKQNEQYISSPECETTEADGYHEQEPYLCADHEESISCDAESEHVENEAVSANEGQAENVNANSECKESETAQELDETEQIEQKHGDNERYDQKREDEKCARKREDPNVQSELYGQDVEQEKQIIMMDHGETESIGGFKHADEHLIDEKDDHETTETDEDQGPELQVPADAFVLEEERKLLGETMDTGLELEVENTSSEVAKQNEQHISSPECETTEADGYHEQEPYLCAGTDHEEIISCDAESEGYKGDAHVENEAVSADEGQAENVDANSECKESETAQELDETEQIEQKHGDNEENDQKLEDEKCARKREDPDNTDVQSELHGQDVEQEKRIIVMDHGETESFGGFKHADERLIDDHEKTEIDEDQGPELQVPADAFVLEEERKLLSETMDTRLELEVENTSSEVAKRNEQHISSPECETTEADGRHERIQKVTAAETVLSSPEDLMEISRPVMKRGFDRVSEDLPEVKIEGHSDWDLQAFEDSSLDFTIQKSRIAVKNPLVRPPKDPRKLLYMVSVEPLLPQPPPCAQKVEVSVPSKGLVGFKLPGLGAGLPALRKTEFGKKAREDGEAERTLHPQQKSVAVTEDSVKQEQASAKPKWTPPKHPGMASPLMMAELKTKLKKPVKE